MPIGIASRNSVSVGVSPKNDEVVEQDVGAEDERDAERDDRELAEEVDDRQHEVDADGVLDAAHVDEREQRDDRGREGDVAGRPP